MSYLIDSDVLIDLSRNRQDVIDYVDALANEWSISQITAMELIFGARNKQEALALDTFLSAYPVVPLSDAIGQRAYRMIKDYSKAHGLPVFDSLIAATCIEHDLTLVTKNRKHFRVIEGLKIQAPEY